MAFRHVITDDGGKIRKGLGKLSQSVNAFWYPPPIPDPLATELWSPSELTASLWLDASLSDSVILDSGSVQQWLDLSGNDRHFTQSNSSFYPGYVSGDRVTFNGTNQRLTSSYTFCNTAPCSVFIVCSSSGTSRTGIIGTRQSDSSNGFIFTFLNSTQNPAFAPIGGSVIAASGSSRALDIYSFERVTPDTSIIRTFVNTSTSVLSTGSFSVASEGTILGAEDLSVFGFFNGAIREVIILESAVTQSNREKIEGYSAHKWGFTANLPIAHPYKTNPPLVFV